MAEEPLHISIGLLMLNKLVLALLELALGLGLALMMLEGLKLLLVGMLVLARWLTPRLGLRAGWAPTPTVA